MNLLSNAVKFSRQGGKIEIVMDKVEKFPLAVSNANSQTEF